LLCCFSLSSLWTVGHFFPTGPFVITRPAALMFDNQMCCKWYRRGSCQRGDQYRCTQRPYNLYRTKEVATLSTTTRVGDWSDSGDEEYRVFRSNIGASSAICMDSSSCDRCSSDQEQEDSRCFTSRSGNGNHSASNGGSSNNAGDDEFSSGDETSWRGGGQARPGISADARVYALRTHTHSADVEPMFVDQAYGSFADHQSASNKGGDEGTFRAHMALAYNDLGMPDARRSADVLIREGMPSSQRALDLQSRQEIGHFGTMQEQSQIPPAFRNAGRTTEGGLSSSAQTVRQMGDYAHLAKDITTLSQQLVRIEAHVQSQIDHGQSRIMHALHSAPPTTSNHSAGVGNSGWTASPSPHVTGNPMHHKHVAAFRCVATALREMQAKPLGNTHAPAATPKRGMAAQSVVFNNTLDTGQHCRVPDYVQPEIANCGAWHSPWRTMQL